MLEHIKDFGRDIFTQFVEQIKVRTGRVIILVTITIGLFYGMFESVTLCIMMSIFVASAYNGVEEYLND